MKEYTEEEIAAALQRIEKMDHYTMCRLWRFTQGESIYFRSDLPTGQRFKDKLFNEFGGFTSEIIKNLGWN